jgi:hypothetical protein
MKLESQITNNHSSLIDNQSKRRSTPVENVRQINPFYAKQSQFDGGSNEHKLRYQKQLQDIIPLAQAKKQSQFKPNLSQNKPNSNPIKANLPPFKGTYLLVFAKKTVYTSGKKNTDEIPMENHFYVHKTRFLKDNGNKHSRSNGIPADIRFRQTQANKHRHYHWRRHRLL